MTILYSLKCKKYTKNKNPRFSNISNKWKMHSAPCAECNCKKNMFNKEQKGSRLLSSLGWSTTLNKIPLLGNIMF